MSKLNLLPDILLIQTRLRRAGEHGVKLLK